MILSEHPRAMWEQSEYSDCSSLHCTKRLYALGPSQMAQQRTDFVSQCLCYSSNRSDDISYLEGITLVGHTSSIGPQTTRIDSIALGCPPALGGRILLGKTPYDLNTGQRELKLKQT